MEAESSRFEIRTPVLAKKKKKKKHCTSKEGHQKHCRERLGDSALASGQPELTKSKKRRQDSDRLLSPPPKKSRVWEGTEEAAPRTKKHKRKKTSALGAGEEASAAQGPVDKENVGDTRRSFREGVDSICAGENKGRKKAVSEQEAEALRAVPQAHAHHHKVRRKKHKDRPREAASPDAGRGRRHASLTLPHAESEGQGALSPASADGEGTELPGSVSKHRSKKRKKKKRRNLQLEAPAEPARPGEASPVRPKKAAGKAGTAENGDALTGVQAPSRGKKKSKKKQHSSEGGAAAAGDRFPRPTGDSEEAPAESPQGDGATGRGRVKHRPREEKTQARSEKKRVEAVHR